VTRYLRCRVNRHNSKNAIVVLEDLKLNEDVETLVSPGDLQKHLQTMFTVLRPEDTIRLVSNTRTHTHTHTVASWHRDRGDDPPDGRAGFSSLLINKKSWTKKLSLDIECPRAEI